MDFFKLDPLNQFSRMAHFDQYESAIWTDRWSEYGDFEVVALASDSFDSIFAPMNYIAFEGSDRVCRVYEREDYVDEEGRQMSRASGRSMEWRMSLVNVYPQLASREVYTMLSDEPTLMARRLASIFANGEMAFPRYTRFLNPTTAAPTTNPRVAIESGPLYDRVKALCDEVQAGFRIVLHPERLTLSSTFLFEVLEGTNRTTLYYGSKLGNFIDENHLVSGYDYRSYARIIDKENQFPLTVSNPNPVPPDISVGWGNRSELFIHATDIAISTEFPNKEEVQAALQFRAEEELAKITYTDLIDGKISEGDPKVYGEDYYLGDKVSVITSKNQRRKGQIVEHIWSDDQSGPKMYPTIKIDQN